MTIQQEKPNVNPIKLIEVCILFFLKKRKICIIRFRFVDFGKTTVVPVVLGSDI